jgi:hypothetical protein
MIVAALSNDQSGRRGEKKKKEKEKKEKKKRNYQPHIRCLK